jgi:hypothetical protein
METIRWYCRQIWTSPPGRGHSSPPSIPTASFMSGGFTCTAQPQSRQRITSSTVDGLPLADSAWHSGAMFYAASPWNDIPGFAIVGAVMGVAFVWVAIRFMFGKKK